MLATAATKWNPTTHTETGPNNGGGPPADPGEEPPTEPGDPEHPKETGHKYPKDNSDAVDLKPAIPEDHYDQSS
ncbi:hypothetical protein KC219_22455, partial [Mycobacterium tuberculosis]|nr:hypothetical protein [Mycobacterium tuberculosis]